MTLFEEIKTVIGQKLGIRLNVPTGLVLVDRDKLSEIIEKYSNGQVSNNPDQILGIYVRHGMRRAIYVQSGLPKSLLLATAAHEFAHAWQGENCPILEDNQMLEGLAWWTAYKTLGYYGYEHQQQALAENKGIIDQGLKWALNTEASEGIRGVIEACKK